MLLKNIHSLKHITAIKIVAGILGIIYSIFQVKYFGSSRDIEIFFASQTTIYLLTSLSQSGLLAEIFLPEYINLKKIYDSKIAHKALSIVINRIIIFGGIVLIITFFLSPYLINVFVPGFSDGDKELTSFIFRICIPLTLLIIINSFLKSVLNAERVFGKAELSSVLNGIVSILMILLLYEKIGIWVLVIVQINGAMMTLLVSIYFLIKKSVRYYFLWDLKEFDHIKFFQSMYSTIFYTTSTQFLSLSVSASLSLLPQGNYAIFNYIQKLFSKINSLVSAPISIILFTTFSEKIAQKKNSFRKKIKGLQKNTLWIGGAVFLCMVGLGDKVLSIIWNGSSLSLDELDKAYMLFCCFGLVMSFQIFHSINRKFTVALGNSKKMYSFLSLNQIGSAICFYVSIYYLGFSGLLVAVIVNRMLTVFIPFYLNYLEKSAFSAPEFSFFLLYTIFLSMFIQFSLFLKKYLFFWNTSDNLWVLIVFTTLNFIILISLYLTFLFLIKVISYSQLKRFFNT